MPLASSYRGWSPNRRRSSRVTPVALRRTDTSSRRTPPGQRRVGRAPYVVHAGLHRPVEDPEAGRRRLRGRRAEPSQPARPASTAANSTPTRAWSCSTGSSKASPAMSMETVTRYRTAPRRRGRGRTVRPEAAGRDPARPQPERSPRCRPACRPPSPAPHQMTGERSASDSTPRRRSTRRWPRRRRRVSHPHRCRRPENYCRDRRTPGRACPGWSPSSTKSVTPSTNHWPDRGPTAPTRSAPNRSSPNIRSARSPAVCERLCHNHQHCAVDSNSGRTIAAR